MESAGGNGASSEVQRIPRSAALDGTATNIAAALRAALHLHSAEQPTIILLLSDAVATHGDTGSALQSVFEAGVPLYLLAPVVESAGSELSVRDLQVPTRVEVGDEVTVRASLHSSRGAEVTVNLEVDGQLSQQQQLSMSGGELAPVSFRLVPRSAGVRLVTVRVASVPDGPGNLQATRTEALNVLGTRPLLYLTSTIEGAGVAGELRALGWEVATLRPSELLSGQSQLMKFGTIVLDNLAIADLPEHSWKTITRSRWV